MTDSADTAWLDSESERTHGLTVRQTLEHADEIAQGMKDRCDAKIREHPEHVVQGVVFSNADVLFLIDAYLELRAHIDGPEAHDGAMIDSAESVGRNDG